MGVGEVKVEELPDEIVIRILTSALCRVYEGEIEVKVDGVGMQINVEPEGVSILGCAERSDNIFGLDDMSFVGPMAVTGV